MALVDTSPRTAYDGAIHRPRAQAMMAAGGIVPSERSSRDLLDKVAATVANWERRWSGQQIAGQLGDTFAELMHTGQVTLGTPALTNLWSDHRPLASCSAVPGPDTPASAEAYYLDNMGSGYNLDPLPDPIAALVELNEHAAAIQGDRRCERYVGNMAHLSVRHPAIEQFIALKTTDPLPHFNLSVNFALTDLQRLGAGDPALGRLLEEIAAAAWACGDPGIICLDRYNATNPLRDQSPYTTTAPCAEVGLAPGDTCLFAYLNLASFAATTTVDGYDLDGLRHAVEVTVQVLDDLLDANQQHLASAVSRALASQKRRVGISVCGYADLLVWLGMDYGSPPAVALLENLLGVIAYHAVSTSIRLAATRGPFDAFAFSDWAARTRPPPPETSHVTSGDWDRLHRQVADHGLRHSSLTALPPSGRSSILLGVNPSIEPFLQDPRTTAETSELRDHAGGQRASVCRTATELPWTAHLSVVEAAAAQVDESVSKTVNLPETATVEVVRDIYLGFMDAGLSAVSVYRPAR